MFAKTKKMKSCVLMTVFSAVLMCSTPLALAAQGDDNDDLEQLQTRLTNEWVMVRNDKIRNIQTFMRQEDGKQYRSFKPESVTLLSHGTRQGLHCKALAGFMRSPSG